MSILATKSDIRFLQLLGWQSNVDDEGSPFPAGSRATLVSWLQEPLEAKFKKKLSQGFFMIPIFGPWCHMLPRNPGLQEPKS